MACSRVGALGAERGRPSHPGRAGRGHDTPRRGAGRSIETYPALEPDQIEAVLLPSMRPPPAPDKVGRAQRRGMGSLPWAVTCPRGNPARYRCSRAPNRSARARRPVPVP
ncbi:hypothetical protein Stsp02_05670 [Streptomyces sp. NBRC 14336]|nr:hypothetical protein Stsp02_05670 [Streptomyces sp. NBRC 14336]